MPEDYESYLFSAASNGVMCRQGRAITPQLFDLLGLEAVGLLRPTVNLTDAYVFQDSSYLHRQVIFDTGTTKDVIDASATNTINEIDLRAADYANGKAYFSSIGMSKPSDFNVAIHENTPIEDASGGSKTDTIRGNAANNHLKGNGGDDFLYGDDGEDKLEGGDGVDRLWGGLKKDVLVGGADNDWLYGEDGDDTYEFTGAHGRDCIDDSDDQGQIRINGTLLGSGIVAKTNGAAGGGWVAKIGGQEYRYRIEKNEGSRTGEQLVIERKGDTANRITINHFNQQQASDGGYLGISIDKTQRLALLRSGADNVLTDPDFDIANLGTLEAKVAEGGSKSFQLFLSAAAQAGDTITLSAGGAGGALLKVVLGDQVVPAEAVALRS